jgi:hypothetical protein
MFNNSLRASSPEGSLFPEAVGVRPLPDRGCAAH